MNEEKKLVADAIANAVEREFGGRKATSVSRLSPLETQVKLWPQGDGAPRYFLVKVSETI